MPVGYSVFAHLTAEKAPRYRAILDALVTEYAFDPGLRWRRSPCGLPPA